MAAQDINTRLDKIIKLLDSIVLPKGSKAQGAAATMRITAIDPQTGTAVVNAPKSTDKVEKKEDKPREVVVKDTPVYINDLSDETKKFFKEVFSFQAPEMKKELTKKGSFWSELFEGLAIVVIGVGIALYTLFNKYIMPWIDGAVLLFKFLISKFDGWWKLLRESTIGEMIKNLLGRLTNLFKEDGIIGKIFAEEGAIGKFFKEGTFLGRLKTNVGKLFSEEGAVGRIFSKEGKIAMFFRDLKAAFQLGKEGAMIKDVTGFMEKVGVWFGRLFREEGPILKALKYFEPLLGKAKLLGSILEKLAWPLMILFSVFEFKAGYEDEMKKGSKDVMVAKIKGAIAFFVNILTLGFVNFEDIKKSIDGIIADFKKGDIVGQIVKVLLLIPEGIGKAIYKVFTWIFSFFDKGAAEIMSKEMKNFSLSEWLTKLSNNIFDFVDKYVIEPITKAWDGLVKFFTSTIPSVFTKLIGNIKDFFITLFESIKKIDVASILKAVPGVSSLMNATDWIKSKVTGVPTPVANPAYKGISQDFISRPGQPVVNFSEKDVIIGAKSGGPLEKAITGSMELNKKFAQMTGAAYTKQEELLTQSVDLLKQILEALGIETDKKSTVIVSNNTRQNNFTMGAITTPTQYRSGVAS
jgi:hypothetical protein